MVAYVSGNTLGLFNTSLDILGGAGQLGDASMGNAGENVTVNAATGNLVISHRDEYLSGLGLDLPILRTYNSLGLLNDDNGDNWRLGYSRTVGSLTGIVNTAGSTVTRTSEDGAAIVYTYDAASGKYVSDAGSGARNTLAFDATTSGWTWTDGDSQSIERYASISGGGQLQSVTDRNGNAITLSWNGNLLTSIADANGERIDLVYDITAGKTANITQISVYTKAAATDATATVLAQRVYYGYDTGNRLSSVTVDLTPADNSTADGKVYTTTYTYVGTTKQLASVTQTDGSQLQFVYDGSGCISQVKDVRSATDIRITTLVYGTQQTTITDAFGNVSTIGYDANGQLTSLTQPGIGSTFYGYDPKGNVTQVTDPKGNITVYGYDAADNRVYERDAAGNTIARTYGSANQLLTETRYRTPDPDGAGSQTASQPETTHYAYDVKGNLRFAVTPEGRVTEYRYDSHGLLTVQISYTGAQFTGATFDEASLTTWGSQQDQTKTERIDTVNDFRGQVSKVTRYATVKADGTGTVDGTQSTTVFIYDAYGELLQTIDPRGVATTGTGAAANDYVATYTYDGIGRVLTRSQTDSNSGSLTLSSTVYNDALRQSTVTLVNGLTTVTTYDRGGHAVSIVQTAATNGNAEMSRTAYVVDTLGRTVAKRITTTSGSLLSSYAIYDAVGRKVADIDAMGSMTEYVYNADSQVIRTIAYATPVSSALLAGDPTAFTLNNLRPASNASDRTTRSLYDAAGRLAKAIDAEGAVTQYQYDGTNKLIGTTQYANELTSAQMTALAGISGEVAPTDANTVPVADAANDRTVRNFTSDDGLLLGTLDAEGYLTEYRYDGSAQQVQTIRYATVTNASVRTTAATVDQLRPAAAAGDITATTLYNDEGQVTGVIDGEGYLTESQYDVAGNVAATIRYANKVTTSSVVGATVGSIRPSSTASDRKVISQYDAYNRVTQTQSLPDNLVTTYQYDAAGNLINVTASPGATQRQDLKRYDVLGRVTAELSGENAARITSGMTQAQIDAVWAGYASHYTYDESGLLASSTDELNRKTLYYYDADGRQAATINALGEVVRTIYDGFGAKKESWRYLGRFSSTQLTGLAGGYADLSNQNDPLTVAVGSIASSGILKSSYDYTLRGQIKNIYDAYTRNTDQYAYNAFGEAITHTTLLDATANTTRQDSFTYDRRGSLTKEQDDGSGINATTTHQYDAFGRVIKTGPTGIITNTSYDHLGRVLTTSTGSTGTSSTIENRQYTYDAFGRTLTLTTNDGTTASVVHSTYDDANRKLTVTTQLGISTTQIHNEFGQTVSVTDGRGNTTAYAYNRDGQLTGVTQYDGAVAVDTTATTYDAAGQVFQVTDNGIVTQYTYDAAGRTLTRTLDPTGLNITTATRYDALGEAIWQQDANGIWTRTDYDLNGRVTMVEVDPTKGPNWTSGADDNPNGLGIKTAYTYNTAGEVITVTEGAGSANPKVTQYTYDKLGRRIKDVVDPNGLAIANGYVYDAAGKLVQKTDANGNKSYYGYDAYGRQTVTVDAAGSVTQTVYDNNDRVTQTRQYKDTLTATALATLPAIASNGTRKDSDLLALLPNGGVADPNFVVTQTLYNADGQKQYVVDAQGDVTRYDYDASGNMVTQTRYAKSITPGNGITGLTPDANNDQVTRYAYDGDNRLSYTEDAAGYIVKYDYDAADHIVRKTAYANQATDPTSSNIAAQVTVNPSSDRVSHAIYDAAGRQTGNIDAAGNVTATQYDKAGNVTSVTTYATPIATVSLPIAVQWSNITVATSPNDRVTYNVFDSTGHMVYAVDALNYLTANTYDALGRVTSTTRYANPVPANTAMTRQGISGVIQTIADATKDQTDSFIYDAAGRLQSSTDASRNHTEYYTYDGLGNKKTFTNKKGDKWTYAYDNVGRLTQEISPQVAMTSVADASGKVSVTASGNYALVTTMAYDALGNLISRTEAGQQVNSDGTLGTVLQTRTTQYQYDNLGRQIKTIFPKTGVYNATADNTFNQTWMADYAIVTATETVRDPAAGNPLFSQVFYDAFGNAVANIDVSGNISIKAYDKLGQVKYDVDALGYVTQYDHDAFGDVTALTRYATATSLIPSSITSAAGVPNVTAVGTAVTNDVTQGNFRRLTTQYDTLGRTVLVTEPSSYVWDPDTNTYFTAAGKRTQTTYDAYGNAIRIDILKATSGSITTHQYFDKLNRQIAAVDALNYLTENTYDANGNLTGTTEYANAVSAATVTDTGYTKPAADTNGKDRATAYGYDQLNRKVCQTRVNIEYSTASDGTSTIGNVTTKYGYDAVGNQTFTTEGVTATNTVGATTYSYYDALGRVTAVAAPSRSIADSNGNATAGSPLTVFRRDAYGNVVVKIDYANGATNVTAAAPPTVATSSNDRTTYTRYDVMGHAVENTDAEAVSSPNHTQYMSYDAAGHLAKRWYRLTLSDGSVHTAFTIYQYDKLGRQTGIVTPVSNTQVQSGQVAAVTQISAGTVTTQTAYNGYGEKISQKAITTTQASATATPVSVQNGAVATWEYDGAGRVWRTNSGDGVVKVMLYDVQGNQVSLIESAGVGLSDRDLSTYTSVSQVSGLTDVRRTDTYYDALGHVVKQVQPQRQEGNGVVTVRQKFANAKVTSLAIQDWQNGALVNTYQNTVDWTLTPFDTLGSGNVHVIMQCTTTTGAAKTIDRRFPPNSAISMTWEGDPVNQITRIQVYKVDRFGVEQLIINQTQQGSSGNVVDVTAPAGETAAPGATPKDAGAVVQLQYRTTGTANWDHPINAPLTDFGDALRFDASTLAQGNYDYRVIVTQPDGTYTTTATGTWSFTTPPLAAISAAMTMNSAGVYSWQTPGTGVTQVFNYRLVGSSTWSSLAVTAQGTTGYDGVSLSGLPAGNYEYELLWTRVNENMPYAHATGQVGTSLPALNSVSTGTNGSAATLIWNVGSQNGSATLHYRIAGSNAAWSSMTASAVYTPHWYPNTSTARTPDYYTYDATPFDLSSLAGGTYETEVLFTASGASSPTMRTAGTLSVTAAAAGYYTTQTSQVWVPATSQSASMAWTSSNTLGVTVNPTSLTWIASASGSGSVLYRVAGSGSAWTTLSASVVGYYAPNTSQARPPDGYKFTVDFSSLAGGTYETQIRYTPTGGSTTQNTGNLTINPATAGHYTTQTTQVWHAPTSQSASFSNTTTPFFAEPNANPGTTATSLPSGGSLAMSQVAQSNGGSTTVRPVIQQGVDRWGNVLSISDARSASWKTYYTYNASNQIISETQPDGNGSLSGTSPVTRWYYDALGRQVATRDARTTYSKDGKTILATGSANDGKGDVNGYVYDAAGNLIQEIHADYNSTTGRGIVTHQYNAFGDEVQQTDAMGHVIRYTVDHLSHRLTTTHVATAQDPILVYTISGSTLSTGATQSITESMTYDEAGHVRTQLNGNQEKTSYRYDLVGNIVSTTAAGGTTWDSYDTQGKKTAETDADGNLATWTYNYFGRLTGHTDLGGAVFSYKYDNAGQLTSQATTSVGQRSANESLAYSYDAAGQLIKIADGAVGETTTYAYDRNGNRVSEKIVKGGVVYEDNHLAYDTLGRLRDITNDQAHVTIDYDAVGNRTHISTHVFSSQGQNQDSNQWFLYDAMNRQTLNEGLDGNGSINAMQGHRITYDKNGNRASDTRVTNKVTYTPGQYMGPSQPAISDSYSSTSGEVTESYAYDAMNRLVTTTRNDGQNNSTVIDNRNYDAASRLLHTGAVLDTRYEQAMDANTGNSADIHYNNYDANGRLAHQYVQTVAGAAKYDVNYTSIDAVGNVLSYQTVSYAVGSSPGSTSTYTTAYKRFESYQQNTVAGSVTVSSGGTSNTSSATSTNTYDANGNLIKVDDSGNAANSRSFVNDQDGHAVWILRSGGVEQQLVVNGEVLGRYGRAVDPTKPLDSQGNPQYIDRADFNFSYQSIRSSDATGPSLYTVSAGDTLQGIAQSFYGDGSLWYVIADANGLTSDADLQVGKSLTIPARTSGLHNNSGTYKPYDAGSVIGSTGPTLNVQLPPPPNQDDGCGTFGTIAAIVIAAIVAAVVNYVVPGTGNAVFDAMIDTFLTESISQEIDVAVGIQDSVDWKGIAVDTLTAGVTQGVGHMPTGMAAGGMADQMAQAAIQNAMKQGIGMLVGTQDHFDWRSVVAAAANTWVQQKVGGGLQSNEAFNDELGGSAPFATRFLSGVATGLTSNVIRGGSVDMTKIAADAFGNALGESLTEQMQGSGPPVGTAANPIVDPDTGDYIVIGAPVKSHVSDSTLALFSSETLAQSGGGNAGNTKQGNLLSTVQEMAGIRPFQPGPLNGIELASLEGGTTQFDFGKVNTNVWGLAQGSDSLDVAYEDRNNACWAPGSSSSSSTLPSTTTGSGAVGDPSDNGVACLNSWLNKDGTVSSDSASGRIERDGKTYYVTSRDENGTGTYVADDPTSRWYPNSKSGNGSLDGAISNNFSIGDRGAQVKDLQSQLKQLGYEVGKADGVYGAKTEAAYQSYLTDMRNGVWNISEDGKYTPNLGDIPVSVVRVVYGEAASQNYASKVGVASVIQNRLDDEKYEFQNLDSYDKVVLQKNAFEAVNGTLYNKAANPENLTGQSLANYNQAARAVINVSNGYVSDPTSGALYYYSPYIPEPSYITRGVAAGTLQQVTPTDVNAKDFLFFKRK